MSIKEQINVSLSQPDKPGLQHFSLVAPSNISKTPRIPKKTRLERPPLSETTSAVMRVIKKVRVERLFEYFEQTCDRRQHETALICGSSQLTYQELDVRANRLAHFLISHGVGRGYTVGILLDRSLDTYIALLGILKAGAAFVPLDPSFSSEQMAFIVEQTGLRDLVTNSVFREKTRVLSCPVIELDRVHEAVSLQQETRPEVKVDPASLCSIIYSFSAAGRPTGVTISHARIVNFLRVVTPIFGLTRNDRVYQGTSIAFDCSFKEIWSAWIAGATLVVGPTDYQCFGFGLANFLARYLVTILCCTPTMLATIESDVPSLRSLFIGGEVCPAYLVSRWSRPGRRMLNTYGTTETTGMATWCEVFPNRPVTIGSPLPTYQVYLLDNQLCPVDDGKSGEICIGGPGVASGYLNCPDLTGERFISNPIWRDREIVPHLYRTGDIGRITPAGEIEYVGRKDALMNSRNYTGGSSALEQVSFTMPNVAPLNEYAMETEYGTGAISEHTGNITWLKLPKQRDFTNIYNHIMTDPLFKNSLFNMASTLIMGVLGFVFWIIIARLYKAENVGIASTLISIMTLLSSFTLLGLNVNLNRYLPKSANKKDLINSSFGIVTIVAILASVIFLLGLQIFSPQLLFLDSNVFYIISFTIFIIFCSWNSLVESTFMAFRAAGNILIKNIIISSLKLALPFVLIAFGAYGIFASTAAALDLGVLASLIILIFNFKIRLSISINVSLVKQTLSYSFANYLTSFMFNMPSLILPVIILNALSAKYAGYYYIASMIQNVLLIIPLATAQALLTEGAYNEAALKKHVKKAIATIFVILIPATAVIVFKGDVLLQFFGKNYVAEDLQFLQLYSVSTIFTAFLLIANAIRNVKHQIKSLVISNVIASVLTLALSYAFISDKLVGIGWGWMFGQVIIGVVSVFSILKTIVSKESSLSL